MREDIVKEIEKKIIRKGIFIFVIIGIVVGGLVGVAAYTYNASQIVYNPSDPNWNVRNVSDAITSIRDSKISSNYSTSEKRVGTWIDGKPLYQRTYTYGNFSIVAPKNEEQIVTLASGLTDINIKNMDTILKLADSNYTETASFKLPTSYITSNGTVAYNYTTYYSNGEIRFRAFLGAGTKYFHSILCTIQYTKTTD